MENITCILCNTSTTQNVIEEAGFTGKKCYSCALIYISPRPTLPEIVDLYGHSNARITAQSHITNSYYKYLHSKHTLSLIKKYKKNGTLLELGAGGGFFLHEAQKIGFNPFALELNPVQAAFIRSSFNIPCEEYPLSYISFAQQTFDIIYHNDVISHLYNPHEAFEIMYEKLNPGGLLIFETGNIADVHGRYYSLFPSFQYPDHLFFFGEKSLQNLLALHRFKLLKTYRYAISLQLYLLALIKKLSNNNMSEKSSNLEKPPAHQLKGIIKNLYHTAIFTLRYKMGACLPKNNKPQTIIIIAQKQL